MIAVLLAVLLAQEQAVLGVETRAPGADEARRAGLPQGVRIQGQIVTSVESKSPAEKAGIKAGDILLTLDANALYSRDDLLDFVAAAKPGAKVKAAVRRGEKDETVEIELGRRKAAAFPWEFAGLAQLDAAREAAKKAGKRVLVGLSGAET
jgi:S1-C subfamily serine protease